MDLGLLVERGIRIPWKARESCLCTTPHLSDLVKLQWHLGICIVKFSTIISSEWMLQAWEPHFENQNPGQRSRWEENRLASPGD